MKMKGFFISLEILVGLILATLIFALVFYYVLGGFQVFQGGWP
ncbi:MAG: hypothetical protein V3U72_05115 [Candidatus Aenigmarchaeota archaeon]